MGQPTTTTSPLDNIQKSSPLAASIEMGNVPAASAPLDSNDNSNTNSSITTVGQERRASIASNSKSTDSIPRRLSKSFQESDLPRGFFAATADMSSSVVAAAARPRSGTQRSAEQQPQSPQQSLQRADTGGLATLDERHLDDDDQTIVANRAALTGSSSSSPDNKEGSETTSQAERVAVGSAAAAVVGAVAGAGAGAAAGEGAAGGSQLYNDYDNGYHFPPRYTTKESFMHGLRAFGHYLITPTGFLVVLYGANIVAWGGMLFLLLCNASKAMCYPTCNNINSPRRKWIEYDSQVLTGLFCVTAFGLAPWRFRDLYFYLQYKIRKDERAMRRLAGVHRGWIRLPGSEQLPVTTGPNNIPADTPASAIPFPETKIPDAPLTGRRAPPTRQWAIVFVLFMNIMNTFLQAVLCGIMWGMNRYDRPSWSTGLFVALGCIAGALGGLGMFWEGKRVKGIEGVPLTDEDRQKLAHDREMGVYHYNNLSGKKPKEKNAAAAIDLEAGKQ